MPRLVTVVVIVLLSLAGSGAQDLDAFPPGFLFGAATASYQIEGAWDTNGKGENIWDHLCHTQPDAIVDRSNGDVAADSYHKYKEDVQILKEMGLGVYRFSISWSRVLPTGEVNEVNQDGIDYYNNLINELLANDIQPMVTMYHWDLPQTLQEIGGWTNPLLVDLFEDYARLLFTTYGDRVKLWLTFNEPQEVAKGYADWNFAPGYGMHGEGDYLVAHTIIKSHARAYHVYDEEFRPIQQGKVSITLSSSWWEPASDSADDIQAANNAIQFHLGWFAHPIYIGDYPAVMKERVAMNSLAEGRPRSRLPVFDQQWIDYIRGTWDFFGINHYTTELATLGETGDNPSRYRDSGAVLYQDQSWPGSASSWLKVVPWGFRNLLNFIKTEYNNPSICVTENGFSDHGEINDEGRINYYTSYLREMLKAYHLDGVDIFGYTAWSPIDNFEWRNGYSERFGLYHVDFTDPERPRTAKDSSRVYGEIVRTGRLPPENKRVN